ncbi:hypothetical protein AVEN_227280-1 [Araneus ventricosus]|uniref:Uncharacterized protein n=1 Tax=Araneus ventricosus TaxID=182803 RepID=A0A4Y2MLN7_ARAVE|nr:hypothetical protein AVEN_227280-1 [Araneus ventricosus]
MSTYRLDAHQSRRTQHRADFAEEPQIRLRQFLHHGCLSRAFILSTPIPSEFTGRPLTTSLEVPEPAEDKRPPPSLKFSPRKKNSKPPSVLLLQPKRPASLRHRQLRHFPFERSPKFRTGPDISSAHKKFRHPPVFSLQRDSAVFTGDHASRRNEEPPEQGKKKRNTFHLPCFSSLGINKLSFHTLRNLRQLSHYLNKA